MGWRFQEFSASQSLMIMWDILAEARHVAPLWMITTLFAKRCGLFHRSSGEFRHF
jgi:hypothetical protein